MRPEPLRAADGLDAAQRGAILIVEDNQVNALILRAMLRKRGYEPFVAADGREGVAMSGLHRPRLVLMDLQMPKLDGFAAASEIREKAEGTDPVLVAVTANTGGEVRSACRAAGFSYVLAKPIAFDELIAVVRRFVDA
jgi:CheY-like chemotaxis protein